VACILSDWVLKRMKAASRVLIVRTLFAGFPMCKGRLNCRHEETNLENDRWCETVSWHQ
jgi:hypothetical protein